MANSSTPNSLGVLQPGQIIRPLVKPDDVPSLVAKLFGLSVVSVKELNSYDDKNFHIQVGATSNNPHIVDVCTHGYTFKILNSMDTKNEKLVAAQNEMMLFLHERGFNVPKPVKNVHGSYMIVQKLKAPVDDFVANNVTEEPSGEYMVRLLTFITGKVLHQVEYTSQLFYECGVYVGKLNKTLQEFQNEALKSRKTIWMLDSTPDLDKFVFAVRNEERHRMIIEILDAWKSNVIPVIPDLQKGFIHGDFNEQNIIVEPEEANSQTFHLSGLIDFGDIQFSCYIFEIAIAIMYVMVEVNVMSPNDCGGHVLAGYLSERSLTSTEWHILKECVAARFAQSLVMGAYSIEQDPGNDYLIVTAAKGWKVLSEFWHTPKDQVIGSWKAIIEAYKK